MSDLSLEANPQDENQNQDIQPKPNLTRRKFIVGGGVALLAAFIFDITVSPWDVLGSQHDRAVKRAEDARNDQLFKEGQEVFAKAFFDSNPTLLKPGDKSLPIVNNPALAILFSYDHFKTLSSSETDAIYLHQGVSSKQLTKEFPTLLATPPHLNYRKYTNEPRFITIAPGDVDLVGLPKDPNTPVSLLAVYDGAENYAGDITLTMGDDRVEVRNTGLGEHRVFLFPVKSE